MRLTGDAQCREPPIGNTVKVPVTRYLLSLLLVTLLSQGWAPAGLSQFSGSDAEQHCAEMGKDGESCACCPEGVLASSGCELRCSGIVAATANTPVFTATPGQDRQRLVVLVRAGLTYLPLNPPPIA